MCYARRQRSSWARIKLSKNLYHIAFRLYNLLSSYSFLASFTLLSIYNSFDEILHLHFFICFVLLSCCSIFNDRCRHLAWQLDYYTTWLFNCQYLFWNFFLFFSPFVFFRAFAQINGCQKRTKIVNSDNWKNTLVFLIRIQTWQEADIW